MKRTIDIVLGSFLAVMALPLVLVLAVGVAISLRAWPFFVQPRVGLGGRLIPFVKLRTLPVSTPRAVSKYDLHVTIPRFARALRRTHLDELPQLLLVPLGYLSLVGPRPEMPFLHDSSDPVFAARRVQVRPGCTGLWQISPDAARLIWDEPKYDLYYVHHQSVVLDVWILWRTALLLAHIGPPAALDEAPQPSARVAAPDLAGVVEPH